MRSGQALGQVEQVTVADVPGGDHDRRAADVVAGVEAGELAAAGAVEGALVAGDGAAKRLVGPERLVGQLEHVLRRLVECHGDFLLDDAAFAGDFLPVKNRVEIHVGQHVHQLGGVAGVGSGVVAGALLAGAGVYVAAEALDLLRDLGGGAAACALEKHVLEEMADAGLARALAAAADGRPDAEADAGHVRQLGRGQSEPIGQSGDMIHSLSISASTPAG